MSAESEELVGRLISLFREEISADIGVMEKRITAVLQCIENVSSPSQATLSTIRKILTGEWDGLLDSLLHSVEEAGRP